MNGNVIKINLQVTISDSSIDQVIRIALEGGIGYWCDKTEVVGNYLGERDSDQISRGGQLLLYDFIEEQELYLDKKSFLEGMKLFILNNGKWKGITNYGLGFYDIDSNSADFIIQYALFGKLKYEQL